MEYTFNYLSIDVGVFPAANIAFAYSRGVGYRGLLGKGGTTLIIGHIYPKAK